MLVNTEIIKVSLICLSASSTVTCLAAIYIRHLSAAADMFAPIAHHEKRYVLYKPMKFGSFEFFYGRCIQETSTGSLTAQSEQILKSRDKQLESVEDKLILCCSNRVAALINGKNLRKNNNPMRSYKAEDSQRNSPLLRKFTSAEDKLRLKVGAPILVTANINQYLFNGTRGVVTHLDNDCITIVVNGNEHKIDRYVFDLSTYSRAVTRKQFPIKLAYAITIHRSQGMTLESYHIDCEDMFLTQQLYVALSRACSVNSFTVSNLDMTDIIPCNAVVTAFLEGQEDEYEVGFSLTNLYFTIRLVRHLSCVE